MRIVELHFLAEPWRRAAFVAIAFVLAWIASRLSQRLAERIAFALAFCACVSQAQVITPAASVRPTMATTLPVN